MISGLLFSVQRSFTFIKAHPQIQFALLLIIVLPLAFLYTSNAFLEAGRSNQDKLQRDRIGLLHDSFVVLLEATNFDTAIAQTQLEKIADLNPDITKFRIVEQQQNTFLVRAGLDTTLVGEEEANKALYQTAAVRFDESLIFPFMEDGVRVWQSVRAISTEGGTYFILTENNFSQIDQYFAEQERTAYVTLGLVYALVLVIAYWHISSVNYRQLYQEAQQAIATKDLFTNLIAHELRAPLTAMKGYASMLQESDLSETNRTYAKRIEEAGNRLLTIVNDLLDVARIQSGKLKVDIEETNLEGVSLAVLEELQSSAKAKDLELISEVPSGLMVAADPKRLHQVLINIISNAIKYTKTGSITIVAETKIRSIEIRIKDTGMGIGAADREKLFAPFFRVDSTDVSAITGTGLGMWITRQFLELMGGTIAIESIKNVGTHVVITLPLPTVSK